jgi:hypothetical protein
MKRQYEPTEEILEKLRERSKNGLLNSLCTAAAPPLRVQEISKEEENIDNIILTA